MSTSTTRRHGDALRAEILRAVLDELRDLGYPGVTYDGVARRARTSKPVLYRRWRSRAHLVLDALTADLPPVLPTPDTGTLRGDLIALLELMRTRFDLIGAQTIRGILADADDELRRVALELTDVFVAEVARSVVQRARDRGEIGPAPVPLLVCSVPVVLLRHELLLADEPTDQRIVEIVDDVGLPLIIDAARA